MILCISEIDCEYLHAYILEMHMASPLLCDVWESRKARGGIDSFVVPDPPCFDGDKNLVVSAAERTPGWRCSH